MIPTYLLVATFVAGLHASYGNVCIQPRNCRTFFCEYGHVQDSMGCNTCDCRTTDPCEETSCGAGEICEANQDPCTYAPCRPTKCVQIEMECPEQCSRDCPYGNEVDDNCCKTCECKPNPCEGHVCEVGTTCEAQRSSCPYQSCAICYNAVCVPNQTCTGPMDEGHCGDYSTRYYYDDAANMCKPFVYSGCGGNGNNFRTIESCKETCASKSEVACEDERVELQCPNENSIEIIYANYGRTSIADCSDARGSYSNINCNNQVRSKDLVAQMCDGASTCRVTASNSVFGDPCGGTLKYLEVSYQCVETPDVQTEIACESEQATLRCPSGTTIDIRYANYGRTSTAQCRRWDYSNVDCNDQGRSKETMIRRCNGVNTCSVAVSNSLFGDTCYGTYKYLEVRYQCIVTPGNTN